MITAAQIAKVMQLTGDFSEPLCVAFGGKAMEDDGRLTGDAGDLAPDCLSLLAPRESGQAATVAMELPCGVMLTSDDFLDTVPTPEIVPEGEVEPAVEQIETNIAPLVITTEDVPVV